MQKFEYSATSARFKVEKMMRQAGIKGPKNGLCPTSGKPKHYAIKLEQSHRQIKKAHRDKYRSTENMYFDYSIADALGELKTADKYATKLKKLLET